MTILIVQHHLQHYNEPPPLPSSGTTSAAPNASSAEGSLPADLLPPVSTYIPLNAEVLPLGPGTLTRNPYVLRRGSSNRHFPADLSRRLAS